jgi:hypothetical protein
MEGFDGLPDETETGLEKAGQKGLTAIALANFVLHKRGIMGILEKSPGKDEVDGVINDLKMENGQLINGILKEHRKAEMAKRKATPDNRKKSLLDYFASHNQFGLEMELDLLAGSILEISFVKKISSNSSGKIGGSS